MLANYLQREGGKGSVYSSKFPHLSQPISITSLNIQGKSHEITESNNLHETSRSSPPLNLTFHKPQKLPFKARAPGIYNQCQVFSLAITTFVGKYFLWRQLSEMCLEF